jgi:hypothetical protein
MCQWNLKGKFSLLSNSLDFPKPAGQRPETLLAGYKRKRAINHTFPFQCSHDAASPDGAASPRRRRLRAGQWELFIFFARPARSALLISGRRRTLIMISHSPIISISSSRSHDVWLHNLHGFPSAVPALVPLHFAARISLLGLQLVPELPQSMLFCRMTQAVPDIGFSLSSLRMLATLPALQRLPSTSWTADP